LAVKETIKVLDPSGGANLSNVRAHNERLVMALVRRHGSLPKSEIAKRTGLSAQTITVIMRSLEQDGLLLRGEPQRGKVGQPSVPMRLNPEGAYSLGINAGRRGVDLILIDFLGNVVETRYRHYAYPTPKEVLDFASSEIASITRSLAPEQQSRIAGIGLSMPFELWNWAEKIGAPQEAMDAWRETDLQQQLTSLTGFTTYLRNDATSACGAELIFGRGPELQNYIYFFVGTFIGGGIVLDHSIYTGPTGYAGAIGPLPVRSTSGKMTQLLEYASVFSLETRLREKGLDYSPIFAETDDWSAFGAVLDDWIDETAEYLAIAILSACSFIDFEAAIIDGVFPASVRTRLCNSTKQNIEKLDRQGLREPVIIEGTLGKHARALGGATLPLFSRYLLDQSVLIN